MYRIKRKNGKHADIFSDIVFTDRYLDKKRREAERYCINYQEQVINELAKGKRFTLGWQKKFEEECKDKKEEKDQQQDNHNRVCYSHAELLNDKSERKKNIYKRKLDNEKKKHQNTVKKHCKEVEKYDYSSSTKQIREKTDAFCGKYCVKSYVDTPDFDRYPRISEQAEKLFGKHPFRSLWVGHSESGKTFKFVNDYNLFFRKDFDEVIVFTPNYKVDSAWKMIIDPPTFYEKFDGSVIEKVIAEQRSLTEKGGRISARKILIVLDDMAAKRDVVRGELLKDLSVRMRHEGISFIILTQMYRLIDTTYRRNVSNVVLFRPENNDETNILVDDWCPPYMTKQEFRTLFMDAAGEQYSFLVIFGTEKEPYEKYWKYEPRNEQLIPVDSTLFVSEKHQNRVTEKWHNKFEETYPEYATQNTEIERVTTRYQHDAI